jgi:hypothetical protein
MLVALCNIISKTLTHKGLKAMKQLFDEHNIRVDGLRVIVTSGERCSNWECIAMFHSVPELGIDGESAARTFAKSITNKY